MNLRLTFQLVLIVIVGSIACLSASAQDAAQKNDYQAMVEKVKAGFQVDFGAMREAYTKTEGYSGHGDGGKKEMLEALSAKKYKSALTLAEKRLETVFVDLYAQYVAFISNHELGNADKENFHRAIFTGLIGSIVDGRDGRTIKTAFNVISINEEKMVILYLGFTEAGKQALMEDEGHHFDALTVKDPKAPKVEFQLFFNIDHFFGKMFGSL